MANQPYPYQGMQQGYGYPNYQAGPAAMGGAVPGVYPGMTAGAYQGTPPAIPSGTTIPGVPGQTAGVTLPGQLPMEQSYIENILRLNLGKIATIYMTFENNTQWNAKVFKGRVEAAGRDHIIISDPKTGMRYLLLMVNLDFITFDEQLNYTYPYQSAAAAAR
jgi:spore germination protein Q